MSPLAVWSARFQEQSEAARLRDQFVARPLGPRGDFLQLGNVPTEIHCIPAAPGGSVRWSVCLQSRTISLVPNLFRE